MGLAFPGACLAGETCCFFCFFQLGRLRCCRVLVQQLWDDFCRIPKFFCLQISFKLHPQRGWVTCQFLHVMEINEFFIQAWCYGPGAAICPIGFSKIQNEHSSKWNNKLRLGKNILNSYSIIWANYNDLSRGHLKWWFSKGIPPKSPTIFIHATESEIRAYAWTILFLTRVRFQYRPLANQIHPFIGAINGLEQITVVFISLDTLAMRNCPDVTGPGGLQPGGIIPLGTIFCMPSLAEIEGALKLLARGMPNPAGAKLGWWWLKPS